MLRNFKTNQVLWLLLLCFLGCQSDSSPVPQNTNTLFQSLSPRAIGIDFENNVEYTEEFNVYTYRNFYNGGGVGIGDVNNDGLMDIYFCGNLVDNRLYLNRGDLAGSEAGFQFEDVTKKAGVASTGVWSTGVAMVDINGDNLLDIYVCKSGAPGGENRHNELFINNGDLTFSEQAAQYGLNDTGLSTHASFFDYDNDGDLDCYLLNNSFRPVGVYDLRPEQRNIPDPDGGNRLFRNDNGRFVNVTEEAGIYSSEIGFGLGVTSGDVNRDGWIDLFVSNDFFERDYLYINQKDGTFKEQLESNMREITMGSMGADMADINNDAFPDLFVTDMLPERPDRLKSKTVFENWNKYQLNLKNGYHHQFTRNALHLNLGIKAKESLPIGFSEISRYAGVSATDWSWGALIFDADNDGWKDLFVANGIYKDLTDLDYINYYSRPEVARSISQQKDGIITQLIDAIPSEPLPNFFFQNQKNLQFENKAEEWGMAIPSFSNGSAYGDLDNDGDLDLVVNNCNMPPFIFQNQADKNGQHYLGVILKGGRKNTQAIGAQVTAFVNGEKRYGEVAPMRGFESSCDARLFFGLGNNENIDSLVIHWPAGEKQLIRDLSSDTLLTFSQKNKTTLAKENKVVPAIFKSLPLSTLGLADAVHSENEYSDFDRDPLLLQMYSCEGPKLELGDLNRDGKTDLILGGAKGDPTKIFIQNGNGFRKTDWALFSEKAELDAEDVDLIIFDANQDGWQDVYIARGSNEYSANSARLSDRLFVNAPGLNWKKDKSIFPSGKFESTSCVKAADFDQDGDQDLFVGIRQFPRRYGLPTNSYLLENDGRGNFVNKTAVLAPGLDSIGMITDACWVDVDGDQDKDLLAVGDWNGIRLLINKEGEFTEQESELQNLKGFWNCVEVADLDADGDMDFVIGNHGTNARWSAAKKTPMRLIINDFDQNGTIEYLPVTTDRGVESPLVLRHDLVAQLPGLRKRFQKYEYYKDAVVSDIFSPEQLESAIVLEVNEMHSVLGINDGKGNFEIQRLPIAAQLSPIHAILLADVMGDKKMEVILGGNYYRAKPEFGINAANYGVLLAEQNGQWESVPQAVSGLNFSGEVKDLKEIELNGQRYLLVARNNEAMQLYKY